jgi:hypothetical protein
MSELVPGVAGIEPSCRPGLTVNHDLAMETV